MTRPEQETTRAGFEDLATPYVDSCGETDPSARRAVLLSLWAGEGRCFDPLVVARDAGSPTRPAPRTTPGSPVAPFASLVPSMDTTTSGASAGSRDRPTPSPLSPASMSRSSTAAAGVAPSSGSSTGRPGS